VRLSCHFFRVYEVCILIVDKRLSLKSWKINFFRYLETEVNCPMCTQNISRNDVKKLVDIDKYLKSNEENEEKETK
jgi:hypothetical protein